MGKKRRNTCLTGFWTPHDDSHMSTTDDSALSDRSLDIFDARKNTQSLWIFYTKEYHISAGTGLSTEPWTKVFLTLSIACNEQRVIIFKRIHPWEDSQALLTPSGVPSWELVEVKEFQHGTEWKAVMHSPINVSRGSVSARQPPTNGLGIQQFPSHEVSVAGAILIVPYWMCKRLALLQNSYTRFYSTLGTKLGDESTFVHLEDAVQ